MSDESTTPSTRKPRKHPKKKEEEVDQAIVRFRENVLVEQGL